LTGANADVRVALKPSQFLDAVLQLGEKVVEKLEWKQENPLPKPLSNPLSSSFVEEMANALVQDRKRSLLLSGINDVSLQVALNHINFMLEHYGTTLDVLQPSLQVQGNDTQMSRLIEEMNQGEIAGLFILQGNPAYDHPQAKAFQSGLSKVPLRVSLHSQRNETYDLSLYSCPNSHDLESWRDEHPHYGVYSLVQPVLAPLYSTRPAVESFLHWAGNPQKAYSFLQESWKEDYFPLQTQFKDFRSFWENTLQKGIFLLEEEFPPKTFQLNSVSRIKNQSSPALPVGAYEPVLYPSIALGAGEQANNPWLQELPDPISKTTWGNAASLSPAEAKKLNIIEGHLAEITDGTTTIQLPLHLQRGLAEGVIAIALGYGRKVLGKIASNDPLEKMFPLEKEGLSGADAYPFLRSKALHLRLLPEMKRIAKTQQYDSQKVPFTGQNRPLALSINIDRLQKEKESLKIEEKEQAKDSQKHAKEHTEALLGSSSSSHATLWEDHPYPGSKWKMSIDLNACTGCSACVIACQAENNIPVVGKAEVLKSREMHWLRLDRYYEESDEGELDVAFMPMLCQHCDNAPCETVCPVLATVHSSEGLNMQVYNRCVGTRYCANNCPYKTRRFNWFDYAHEDLTQNLVLNPDITVRSRGIMEKCSFCVQRITKAKIEAKGEGRIPKDGEIQPACMQSCPANAIQFGDCNDPQSAVSKSLQDPRSYTVLGELGVKPSVNYLKKIRNRKG
jgi:Fe-S-cluster-containing dehydrogenase component